MGIGIDDLRPTSHGTGFFITEDGFLVTSAHIVEGAKHIRVVTSADTITAKTVKMDLVSNLALLKAEGHFAALAIGTNRNHLGPRYPGTNLPPHAGAILARGNNNPWSNFSFTTQQQVSIIQGDGRNNNPWSNFPFVTVGFPDLGLPRSARCGVLGDVADQAPQGQPRYMSLFPPVRPGNSGGALLDERGNVVGVVSARLDPPKASATSVTMQGSIKYAVESSFLLSFLESVPNVSAKLKDPNVTDQKFEDVVKSAEQAAALVLVY